MHKQETSIGTEFTDVYCLNTIYLTVKFMVHKIFSLYVDAYIQSVDPVEHFVIIKFELVCKSVRTCKAQQLLLQRWEDEDCFLPWQGSKCQTQYRHRDMVLSEGNPLCRLLFFVGIPLSGTLWHQKVGEGCTSSLGAHLETQHFCMGEFCECSRGEQLPEVLSKDASEKISSHLYQLQKI